MKKPKIGDQVKHLLTGDIFEVKRTTKNYVILGIGGKENMVEKERFHNFWERVEEDFRPPHKKVK